MELSGPSVVSIKVDQADDEYPLNAEGPPKWMPWSTYTSPHPFNRPSTNAPRQSLSLYYLASLTPSLLAAILENIDISSISKLRMEVRHWLRRVLHLIVNTKIDTYLDLLAVIAYHSPKARYTAASLLSAFWPKAVGHVTVSKPFPVAGHLELVGSNPNAAGLHENHPYTHQFVSWRFSPRSGGKNTLVECRACAVPIHGYGLLCPFCMCAVHLGCYDHPEGSRVVKYVMESDEKIKQIATYRFSTMQPNRRGFDPSKLKTHQHLFTFVNLFTLSLCFMCRKPLWGCYLQAMKCSKCSQFAHFACASGKDAPPCDKPKVNSSHINIQWSALRQSCLEFYNDLLYLTEADLAERSYEDVSVFFGILWVQLRLMTNGVSFGSIVVMQKGKNAAHAKEHRVDEFELHRVLRWCETRLSSYPLPLSFATEDYFRENGIQQFEHSLMFDWSNLIYICSVVKVPYVPPVIAQSSSDLLIVEQSSSVDHDSEQGYPFEVVSILDVRDVLGHEFNIHSDTAARYFLSHMHHLGFFDRTDANPFLFKGDGALDKEICCTFPIPLGLDSSADVETLFASVEACLSDLDLCINEVGFLLLSRRLWPNGMASEYALRRLARGILSWVIAEVLGCSCSRKYGITLSLSF